MKALITGANGFLGRYVAEQLAQRGDPIRVLIRRPCAALEALGAEIHYGDLRSAADVHQAVRDVEIVHHVAGIAGIWGRWRDYYDINVAGTHHIINACRAHRVSRLVYTSSPSVVFDGSNQRELNESAPYPRNWLCHYPRSKALAEQAVLAANDHDLRTCALRPHLIWGPGDRHLIPRLIHRARSGRLRQVGEGKNLIDTVYVENAARAHVQAGDALEPNSRVAGQAYFITQGEPVSCWAWINQVLELVDLPPIQKRISLKRACQLGQLLESVYRWLPAQLEPPMTRFLALQLACDHYYSIEKARRDFGYEPLVSLDEGMLHLQNALKRERAIEPA